MLSIPATTVDRDAQGACQVDGRLDAGWARSGAARIDTLPGVAALAHRFEAAADEARQALAAQTAQRLAHDLETALDAVRHGATVDSVVTAHDGLPGVARSDRGLYAWAHDPRAAAAAMIVGSRPLLLPRHPPQRHPVTAVRS